MMSDSNFHQPNINPPSVDHPNFFNHGSFDNNLYSIIEDYYHRHYRSSEVSSYISYVNHFLNDDSPPPPLNNTGHGFGSSLSPPSAGGVVTQERSSTTTTGSSSGSFDGTPPTSSSHSQMIGCNNNEMKRKSKVNKEEQAIAFRTKTELPVLDDGYKWRKYGKKMVKSNTNPRHYYKCVNEGCNVKKKIERDPEDIDYLITTYEGIHNHESPFICLLPENVASFCFTVDL